MEVLFFKENQFNKPFHSVQDIGDLMLILVRTGNLEFPLPSVTWPMFTDAESCSPAVLSTIRCLYVQYSLEILKQETEVQIPTHKILDDFRQISP